MVLEEGRLLRLLGVVLNDEARGIELLLALELLLLVHIGEALVLLLDAAELDAPGLSALHERVLRVRESDHKIEQVLLGQAVAVS